MADELEFAFARSVEEGRRRVTRSWRSLLATGTVGGIDLGIGVIALLVTEQATGSHLLGALAFSIGFIALMLAHSELFTENFLVPVAAVAARKATTRDVVRLWVGTAVANLVGGWLVMAITISALPELGEPARKLASFYIELGIGWQALGLAILGGVAITLMTWMERGTSSIGAKLVAAVGTAYVLVGTPLNHSIVGSLEMFAALQSGAPFGYLDWLGALGVAVVGNAIGGLGLVTVLRLAQVEPETLRAQRHRSIEEVERAEDQEKEGVGASS